MNTGKIISLDTPKHIKSSINKQVVEIVCNQVRDAYKLVKDQTDFEVQMFGDRIDVMVNNFDNDYKILEKILHDNEVEIVSHRIISASLENVFISLVSGE